MADKVPAEKRVMVVRTIPVEQMDSVLAACQKRWPEKEVFVVTDFAGNSEMMADSRVSDTIVPSKLTEGFRGVWATHERAEILVIPVTNGNGVGFANAMNFLRKVYARQWYLASYASELQPVSPSTLRSRVRMESVFRILCMPFAWAIAQVFTSFEPEPSSTRSVPNA